MFNFNVADASQVADEDGVPMLGPMANFVHARLEQAFKKYMDDLNADPNGFPNGPHHKAYMREAKLKAIAEWKKLNPNTE